MTALDTTVIVRLVVRHDPVLVARAAALIRRHGCWIPTTELLEAEWVLRAVYGYTREQVVKALERLASMENVEIERARDVGLALDWHRLGLDFADTLHLTASQGCDAFATFDAALRKAAKRHRLRPEVIEP